MAEADPGTTRLAADLAGKRVPLASVPVVDFQPFLAGGDDSFKYRGAHAAEPGE
jgi:hypothetical protein